MPKTKAEVLEEMASERAALECVELARELKMRGSQKP
jgi:hypothetical protein